MANRTDLDNIPLVQGLMSYREDNKKLYVTNGRSWEALGKQKQIDKQEKLINALKKQINKQRKEVFIIVILPSFYLFVCNT